MRGLIPGMKVDDYMTLTSMIEVVLVAAGGIAGSYAWSPYPVGYMIGAAIGFGAAYIVVEILDRLYVLCSDPKRLRRELDEGRRRQREQERRRRK
ncbi:MAG: hypothetical protein JSU06_00420 [Actinobacteria bacterium]|nr:hypothetical protein [Actinomycetota bacterium]